MRGGAILKGTAEPW